MTDVLVSIIIPTYNRLEKLKKAIDSVLGQSYENFEIIVVDDGSTDGTKDYIRSILDDSRIKYFYKVNEGLPSISRNLGASHSKGKYLTFLDSDDEWSSDKLSIQVDFHEKNPDYIFSFTQAQTVAKKNISKSSLNKSGFIGKSLLLRNFIVTSSVLVKVDAFVACGGFSKDVSIVVAEDYDLWLKLSERGKAKFFKDALVRYELGNGLSSQNILLNLSCFYTVIVNALNRSRHGPLFNELVIFLYWARCISGSFRRHDVLSDSLIKIKTLKSNYLSRLGILFVASVKGRLNENS